MLFADDVEQRLMASSRRFRDLDEQGRGFVCAFLRLAVARRKRGQGPPSVSAVGEAIGVGKTLAYELWRRADILECIRAGTQAHGDLADVAGSVALDLLLYDALSQVQSGSLRAHNIPPSTLKLLSDAKIRLGLVPGSATAAVALGAGDGRSVSASATGGTDDDAARAVIDLVTKLRGAVGGAEAAGSEAESAEVVRGEAVAAGLPEGGVAGGGVLAAGCLRRPGVDLAAVPARKVFDTIDGVASRTVDAATPGAMVELLERCGNGRAPEEGEVAPDRPLQQAAGDEVIARREDGVGWGWECDLDVGGHGAAAPRALRESIELEASVRKIFQKNSGSF